MDGWMMGGLQNYLVLGTDYVISPRRYNVRSCLTSIHVSEVLYSSR